ncbi:hypothetical protein B0A58_07450 [Flavobacterium branchiophilum NBRC 15030 = ATCC 35035]|uniref:Uncharacterized protein n=1 Tax=Flavobacterium branchiophilum TaxID=55197 RepID=A0A543G113_9FLAO|nr:hypothetical protein [Flavobacterium branchiophilum]OXA76399.1 hypothetical protein B0A58_07450 [Flavobacterium branchiophilum NBRC 15030 = ATCC 35035]TQM39776.1 hypothetical protein BC670_0607 [Flavobacterium branchiophilum]GEM55237.1 hypothetical protein FB1_14580 [Flavobacterium branchiophilum NBRC 15030 = ATCC 35035]
MIQEENIAGAIKALTKLSDQIYAKVCRVLAINETEKTVDVKPIDDSAEIFDVRLQADSETGGLVLFPKKGSAVLVVFINKNNAAVINTSEIEKLDLVIEGVNLQIDKDGFLLKKENETLKILMADLIKAIQNISFSVITNGSATTQAGTTQAMINLAQFQSIETRFNQFLK